MKLNKILEDVGQIDKGSFLKIVDSLSNEHRGKVKEIDKILANTAKSGQSEHLIPV